MLGLQFYQFVSKNSGFTNFLRFKIKIFEKFVLILKDFEFFFKLRTDFLTSQIKTENARSLGNLSILERRHAAKIYYIKLQTNVGKT